MPVARGYASYLIVEVPMPVTRPSDSSTASPPSPSMPWTVTLSPSGSTPDTGTVTVRGSPETTLAEKLRATGAWLGLVAPGSGLTVTEMRPERALDLSPIG